MCETMKNKKFRVIARLASHSGAVYVRMQYMYACNQVNPTQYMYACNLPRFSIKAVSTASATVGRTSLSIAAADKRFPASFAACARFVCSSRAAIRLRADELGVSWGGIAVKVSWGGIDEKVSLVRNRRELELVWRRSQGELIMRLRHKQATSQKAGIQRTCLALRCLFHRILAPKSVALLRCAGNDHQ